MIRKWKDSQGLTLVEMLCGVAILVLLGLLVNTGLGLAVHSYQDLTTQSELEVLAVSLSNALSDELRYAKGPISTPTDGVLVYHSERYNNTDTETKLRIDNGRLYANDYPVLPGGSYGNGAYIIPENGLTITRTGDLFEVKLTVEQADGELLAGPVTFSVRWLNPNTQETT